MLPEINMAYAILMGDCRIKKWFCTKRVNEVTREEVKVLCWKYAHLGSGVIYFKNMEMHVLLVYDWSIFSALVYTVH